MEVAHISGDLEDVHEETKQAEQHEPSCNVKTEGLACEMTHQKQRQEVLLGVLTLEPHRPSIAIFKQDCSVLSGGDEHVKQHPQHSEEEEDNEEDLPVHCCNGRDVEGTAADQSTAQHQDVDEDYAREEPSTTLGGLPLNYFHMVSTFFIIRHIGKMGRAGQMLDAVHLC